VATARKVIRLRTVLATHVRLHLQVSIEQHVVDHAEALHVTSSATETSTMNAPMSTHSCQRIRRRRWKSSSINSHPL
jgi:hypothetical protein